MADAFGLVEPDHRLGHRVVVAVTNGADGGERAGVCEPFGVADSGVLGGFKWSSQHLDQEVWDGTTTGLGFGDDWEAANAVAGATTGQA